MISCRMQPSDALLGRLRAVGVVDPAKAADVQKALDDLLCVDTLADLLDEALCETTKGDGRLDLKAVAEHVVKRMKAHQFTSASSRPFT